MTSGNRAGIKMYSFNTTVRMPDKNIEFLDLFRKYEGKLFDTEERTQFYIDAINSGIVSPKNISDESREKLRIGIPLTGQELKTVLEDNKPRNGFGGRVGDFLGAMSSQGFIQKQGKRFRLTQLGNQLIENPENEQDIYTKAMIKLQYGSIDRGTADNKAIPFLNLLFTINELNIKYKNDSKYANRGISEYEIGVFILTMSDCNYKKTAAEIESYRDRYNGKADEAFALNFIHTKRKILSIQYNTIFGSASYTDEVMRKFKKTGLLAEHRGFNRNNYFNFSVIEIEKIKLLLEEYDNYSWKKYTDADLYFADMEDVVLPWERSDSAYARTMAKKAELVGMVEELKNKDRATYQKIEEKYNNFVFQNSNYSDEIPSEIIMSELEMINGRMKGKSILPDTENYIKLEWFSALLLSKKFGKEHVKSNLTYYDDGTPKSCAGGNTPDIEFDAKDIDYNIEVTTISNATQQENNETTSVIRHINEKSEMTNKQCRAIMVAPYIHYDTITIYKIATSDRTINTKAIPITIDAFISLVGESGSLEDFNIRVDEIYSRMINSTPHDYQRFINGIKVDVESCLLSEE